MLCSVMAGVYSGLNVLVKVSVDIVFVKAGVYSGLNILVKVSVDVVFYYGRCLQWTERSCESEC